CCLVERRREEGARRVRFVVLGVEDVAVVAKALPQLPIDEQLFFDPEWAGLEERGEPSGRDSEIGLQDPLEIEQRLIIVRKEIELASPESAGGEAVVDCVRRERRITLLAGEAFL